MLNRTTRAAAVSAGSGRPEPELGKECAEFEKCTAEATETLADGLEQITGKAFPMLHDASREMLAAAEVLPACKFEAAVPHDKEALSNLIKARNTVRLALAKPRSAASAEQLRNFDRRQVQKLRRPKELDEKEAEQVADRLRQLAKQEEFVYATVSKPSDEATKPARGWARALARWRISSAPSPKEAIKLRSGPRHSTGSRNSFASPTLRPSSSGSISSR